MNPENDESHSWAAFIDVRCSWLHLLCCAALGCDEQPLCLVVMCFMQGISYKYPIQHPDFRPAEDGLRTRMARVREAQHSARQELKEGVRMYKTQSRRMMVGAGKPKRKKKKKKSSKSMAAAAALDLGVEETIQEVNVDEL